MKIGPVKRLLPAMVVLCAFVSVRALGDWQQTSVTGTPRDVDVVDAGHYAIATSSGFFEYVDSSSVLSDPRASISATISPSGCLEALSGSGQIMGAASCRTEYSVGV